MKNPYQTLESRFSPTNPNSKVEIHGSTVTKIIIVLIVAGIYASILIPAYMGRLD